MRARQPVIPSEAELSFRAKPNCHSERSRTVIPSEAELSFRAKPNCHSERSRTVIPSEAELSFRADPNCHSERTRTVIPSEAELSFRADPNCHSERSRTVIPSEAEESPREMLRLRFDCAFSSAQHDRHPFTSSKIMPILVQQPPRINRGDVGRGRPVGDQLCYRFARQRTVVDALRPVAGGDVDVVPTGC